MGRHAEPVREVRLPRQGLVGSAPPEPISRGRSGAGVRGERREFLHALRLQLRAVCKGSLRKGVAKLRRLRGQRWARQPPRAPALDECADPLMSRTKNAAPPSSEERQWW